MKKPLNAMTNEDLENRVDPNLLAEYRNKLDSLPEEKRKDIESSLLNFLIPNDLKVKKSEELLEKLKKNDVFTLIFGMIGLIFNVASNSLYMKYTKTIEPDAKINLIAVGKETSTVRCLRFVTSVTTFFLIVTLIRHYYIRLETLIFKQKVKSNAGLWASGLLLKMLFEIVVCLFHSFPYCEGITIQFTSTTGTNAEKYDIDVDLFLSSIIPLRLYLLFKFFSFYSSWGDDKAEKICNECNTTGGVSFAIKAELKEKPYIMVGLLMLSSILIFGYALRNIEIGFMQFKTEEKFLDWSFILNGFWCVIITILTVGYGDYYPQTLLGRVLAVAACLWGTFLISMMVISITISLEFSSQQQKAYEELNKGEQRAKLKERSLEFIRYSARLKDFQQNLTNIIDPDLKLFFSRLMDNYSHALQNLRSYRQYMISEEHEMSAENILYKLNETVSEEMENLISFSNSQITMLNEYLNLSQKIQEEMTVYINKAATLSNALDECLKAQDEVKEEKTKENEEKKAE